MKCVRLPSALRAGRYRLHGRHGGHAAHARSTSGLTGRCSQWTPGRRGSVRPGAGAKAAAECVSQQEWAEEGCVMAGRRFSSRASRSAIAANHGERSLIGSLAFAKNLLSRLGAGLARSAHPRRTRSASAGPCSGCRRVGRRRHRNRAPPQSRRMRRRMMCPRHSSERRAPRVGAAA